ncbi:MAG: hypothetical protein K0U40_09485 [Betaproteobacteria bacterium]|nr:hypothetical protein [Betaproteobacteria bacterium]
MESDYNSTMIDPWYWIAQEGKDTWNRLMREAWEQQKSSSDTHRANFDLDFTAIKESGLEELNLLTEQEKKSILKRVRNNCPAVKSITILLNDFLHLRWSMTFSDSDRKTIWKGNADFSGFIFPCLVFFKNMIFEETANFDGAYFVKNTDFQDTHFKKGFSARNAIFNRQFFAIKLDTDTNYKVDFSGAKFRQDITLNGSKFKGEVTFKDTQLVEKQVSQTLFLGEMSILQRQNFILKMDKR